MDVASYLATNVQNAMIAAAFEIIVIIVLAVFILAMEHRSYGG